jgi:hypothetical protein
LAVLTFVEIVRSVVSFGLATFVSLYWIRHLRASAALGGIALTLEPGGEVLGARIGPVRTVQLDTALLVPALLACWPAGLRQQVRRAAPGARCRARRQYSFRRPRQARAGLPAARPSTATGVYLRP